MTTALQCLFNDLGTCVARPDEMCGCKLIRETFPKLYGERVASLYVQQHDIRLDDPRSWPKHGSIWLHRNGNRYRVYLYTNIESERQDEYPTTIVYQNVANLKLYSRRLVDWSRSMTAEPAGGYRGFESVEAYEKHYADIRNYKDELPAMEQYTREAMADSVVYDLENKDDGE